MADLTAQFDALKKLLTHLTDKETKTTPVPDADWAAAGVKPGTRLKDIEKKVTELKKKVGHANKNTTLVEEFGEEGAAKIEAGLISAVALRKERNAEAEEKAGIASHEDAKLKERAVSDRNRLERDKKNSGRTTDDTIDAGQVDGFWLQTEKKE